MIRVAWRIFATTFIPIERLLSGCLTRQPLGNPTGLSRSRGTNPETQHLYLKIRNPYVPLLKTAHMMEIQRFLSLIRYRYRPIAIIDWTPRCLSSIFSQA